MFRALFIFTILVSPALLLAHYAVFPALESLKYTYENVDEIAKEAAGVPKHLQSEL